MEPEVQLIVGAVSIRLVPDQIEEIDNEEVVLLVRGAEGPLELDGRAGPWVESLGGRILAVDLRRSTGFHHLRVYPNHHYVFATSDGKLKLEGIEAVLRYLRSEGLHWSGQMFFSDGGTLRDQHVVYGWLDRHADDALRSARAIADRPRLLRRRITRSSAHPTGAVVPGATLRLLRSMGSDAFDKSATGPVWVGGVGRVPRRVVVSAHAPSVDTPANRRAAWLGRTVGDLAREVLRGGGSADAAVSARCGEWIRRSSELIRRKPFGRLGKFRTGPVGRPSFEERVDARYAAVYDLTRDLVDRLGWNPSRRPAHRYSFVHYADEIFQEFVGLILAEALSLSPQGRRADGLRFRSDDWDCYINVVPPADVLRSWTSYSGQPDNFRPDVLLVCRKNGAVVLADAKYRNDGADASRSSRRDLMSYMEAFSLPRVLVFFPPQAGGLGITRVAHDERALVEVKVLPVPDLADFFARELPVVLAECAEVPRWRGG